MIEYIKRDDALSHPFANGRYDHKNANEDFILGFESYKEWLETLPVIDAVEVVRCKDCKYYKRSFFRSDLMRCHNPKIDNDVQSEETLVVNDDFFCAYGEKKEGNNG